MGFEENDLFLIRTYFHGIFRANIPHKLDQLCLSEIFLIKIELSNETIHPMQKVHKPILLMTSLTMETDAVVLVDSENAEGFVMPL